MITKLSFSHDVIEKKHLGVFSINQSMNIVCDYNTEDKSIDNVSVYIYQNGKFLAEISKLLDKAEGNPLLTMIEAINWEEIYKNKE